MDTAILANGESYYIPLSDVGFFKELASRMKWKTTKEAEEASNAKSWVDDFAGKWQDSRSAEEIIMDIHNARSKNSEISL